MNFHEFKDEFLKWLVPALLTGMFYELLVLNNTMIEQKSRLGFVEYRMDQHRALLLDHTAAIAENRVQIAMLQAVRKSQ